MMFGEREHIPTLFSVSHCARFVTVLFLGELFMIVERTSVMLGSAADISFAPRGIKKWRKVAHSKQAEQYFHWDPWADRKILGLATATGTRIRLQYSVALGKWEQVVDESECLPAYCKPTIYCLCDYPSNISLANCTAFPTGAISIRL
jgi:hypothetical protein